MTWRASSTLSSPRSFPPSTNHLCRKNWRSSGPSTAKPGTLPIPIPELALPEPLGSSTSATRRLCESCKDELRPRDDRKPIVPNHGKADFPDTPKGVLSIKDRPSRRQISDTSRLVSLREHCTRHFLDNRSREW